VGAAAIDFVLRGEHITLDALLKATGLAPSGGAAKALIADGGVTVDGAVERRRGAKLRAGARVVVQGQAVQLRAAEVGADGPAPSGPVPQGPPPPDAEAPETTSPPDRLA
jgi:ribosome-associated protein